jgi:hypothetical protein
MKKLFSFLLAFALAGSINAQAPVIQWQKTFGGTALDDDGSVQFNLTADGGYIFRRSVPLQTMVMFPEITEVLIGG